MAVIWKKNGRKLKIEVQDFGITIKGDKRVEVISYIKGVAIIAIIFRHLIGDYLSDIPELFKILSMVGGAGIHVFFFCSGFGLFWAPNNHYDNVLNYAKDRLRKVYLPYVIVVITIFVIGLRGRNIYALMSHIFFYKMFIPRYDESFGAHFWYMSTIFQLYALYPILIKIKQRMRKTSFAVWSIAISLIWTLIIVMFGKYQIRTWNGFAFAYLFEFSLGIYFAEGLKENVIVINKWTIWMVMIVAMTLYGVLGVKGGVYSAFNDIPGFAGMLAFCVLIYSVSGKKVKKAICLVSDYSYELYLTHVLVFDLFFEFLKLEGVVIELIIAICALVCCGIVAILYKVLMHRTIRII